MELQLLMDGFRTILLNPENFMFILIGVTAGIMIGALPGLTATMGVALLVPFTFGRPPIAGLVMLLGIFQGGIYGGSISAILMHTPGTPSAAATCMDGFPMSQKGEAGKAIGISTIASGLAGLISALIMSFVSPQIARIALKFGPPEFFALAIFGLSVIIAISGDSLLKGFIIGAAGLLLTTIGFDPLSGVPRFTLGQEELLEGISFIPALIGLFGYAQVFRGIEKMGIGREIKTRISNILPRLYELGSLMRTIIKSALIGTCIGAVPGAGCDIAAFVAYGEAKRSSKEPEKFGTGILEGVAAPESGNNGAVGGAMIPMLTLGVPGDAVTAVLLGALTIHGFQPGPLLFRDHPEVVYPIFAGMILTAIMILIVGLLGARLYARIITVDDRLLLPVIFFLCIMGSYSMRFDFFDVGVSLVIGVVAYFMNYYGFPSSPVLLALILGPMAEQNMRRSLMISRGDPTIFLTRPICILFLCLAILFVLTSYYRRKRMLERVKELSENQSPPRVENVEENKREP